MPRMQLGGVPLRQAVASYSKVSPTSLRGALRMAIAYARAAQVVLLRSSEFHSVGHLLPGRDLLRVKVDGILADVRPGTADLGLLAATLEPQAASWFTVHAGDVVVDVGAQIGRYALLAAPKASVVIAFEPEPSNHALLQRNVAVNGFANVQALPIAISDVQGKARLYLPGRGDTGTSSLDPSWSAASQHGAAQSVEVLCDTLDSVLAPFELNQIDWLKVDVEGLEVQALKGGSATLRKTAALILEVADEHKEACRQLARAAGLHLRKEEKAGGAKTSNWLFTREKMVSSGPTAVSGREG